MSLQKLTKAITQDIYRNSTHIYTFTAATLHRHMLLLLLYTLQCLKKSNRLDFWS